MLQGFVATFISYLHGQRQLQHTLWYIWLSWTYWWKSVY